MPIASTKLQYEVRRRINRVASEFNENLDAADVDSFLNEALAIWFENSVKIAETSQKVRNDLRQLEVKKKSLELSKIDAQCIKAVYPNDFYQLLRQEAVVKKTGCGKKVINVHIFQSDDLNEALKDPYWEPSFEYEETIADEAGDGLIVYFKDFKVDTVLIDYYRKHPDIATPSLYAEKEYVNSSGEKIKEDQGLLLTATYCEKDIEDIAALIALRDSGNVRDYQTQLDKILRTNTLR